MDIQSIIDDINEHIVTNNTHAITPGVLRGILLDICEALQTAGQGGGGTGGTSNYNALSNRPSINGATLSGDMEMKINGYSLNGNHTAAQLGISSDSRNEGANTVTLLTSLPVDKRLVIASISANGAISLAQELNAGEELYVIITASGNRTVTLQSTSRWRNMDGSTVSLSDGETAEISILCWQRVGGQGYYTTTIKTAE